jgi:hypothetical protein
MLKNEDVNRLGQSQPEGTSIDKIKYQLLLVITSIVSFIIGNLPTLRPSELHLTT